MKQQILSALAESYPWKDRLHWFDSTGSTNDALKELARTGAPHGTVLLADHQTGGRGRMGRSFQSPAGMGIYLSLLLRPEASAEDLMHLTCATAVAVCDALEDATGLRPGIKWTNDLVWNQRKLGGILTELGFGANGTVEYAIVGIGINCSQAEEDFDLELRRIATSLAMMPGRHPHRSAVISSLLSALELMSRELVAHRAEILRRYRGDCITLGQQISIVRGDCIRHGTALDVDDLGALVVAFPDGHTEAVNSGEVSIRGMYGYV